MMEKENLYFIAIIPPPEICSEINGFKQDFAERFFCKAALKVIPHITLKAPFKLEPSRHAPLLEWFQNLHLSLQRFKVELRGFGVFPKKASPVIFVQPVMNEQLKALQAGILKKFIDQYPQINISETELDFYPHITIAYRDLDPKLFTTAWQEHKDKKYEAIMKVNDFHLLQHDGKKWNVINSVFLSPVDR